MSATYTELPTSLQSSTCYCSSPLLNLVEEHFVGTHSIFSSYNDQVSSDWLEIPNDVICVSSSNWSRTLRYTAFFQACDTVESITSSTIV